jgi:PTH1 family peptidyl-tRNA hydrolase
LDRLAAKNGVAIAKKKYESLVGEWDRDGEKVLLAKPQTFMNLSGQALQGLLRNQQFEAKDVLVVHDDIDLPFGRIRIREQGSAGGHRGMISVLEMLPGKSFCRLRIGIGRPPPGVDPADFVLQRFSTNELVRLAEIVSRADEAIECFLAEGVRWAMEKFNRAE